jgi:nitroimidazol reductase NimA-like FMN-containing flavoprotein (pyridoxamine 5'-phosphate oxidase superfamily)
MKKVTRDIEIASVRDLLERVPRARLAFANDQGPEAQPVRFVLRDDQYLVGIHNDSRYIPQPGQDVALLIDEGVYYFELRAVYIRGQVHLVEAPSDTQDECTWFEVEALKVVAWDYGSMREV